MTDQLPSPDRMLAADPKPGQNWPDPDTDRAQPGDILGIERGGESTSLGDTEGDEDERRRDAEDEAKEDAEDEAKE
jgi:hypothetical protein